MMDRNNLTKAERYWIANRLAETNLPPLNAVDKEIRVSRTFYAIYTKRLLDISVSVIALFVMLPINLIAAVLTYIDVGWPIFFSQERVGRDGHIFTIVKFRNMTNEKDEHGELLPGSQRVTRFGRFMRKTSLDELLNFWSVLKGDMSLIGPRPLLPQYMTRYSDRHRMRLAVRPGLECPPHKLEKRAWTWQEQFDNDIWYVENVSFKTDCIMILNLIRFAFDPVSMGARGGVARKSFMGYDSEGQAIDFDQVPDTLVQAAFKLRGDEVE